MVDVRGLLTRGYAKIGFGGISDTEQYENRDVEATIYWFSGDSWLAGQYTPWGTILLDSDLREQSEDLKEYVFLHEYGHGKMPGIPKLLLFLLRLVFTLLLLSIPFAFVYYPYLALSNPYVSLPEAGAAFILGTVLVLAPYIVVSWTDEGYAELFVASKLGPDEYLNRYHELRELKDSGRIKRLWVLLTYPRPRLVAWLSRRTSSTPE